MTTLREAAAAAFNLLYLQGLANGNVGTTLRAVLEAEPQEPVGWFVHVPPHGWQEVLKEYEGEGKPIPLYAAPPADRDAERLDWLVSKGAQVVEDEEGTYVYWQTSNRMGPVADTARDAIDAAMAEDKG